MSDILANVLEGEHKWSNRCIEKNKNPKHNQSKNNQPSYNKKKKDS